MPSYRYVGDEPRHFPTLGRTLEPGEEFDTDQVVGSALIETAAGESTADVDTPNNADPNPDAGLAIGVRAEVAALAAERGFEDLTKAELLDLAQDLDIHGRSQMTKDELAAALSEVAAATPTEPVAGEGDNPSTEE